jgi:hypothetical protein
METAQPPIPGLSDLASAPMRHNFMELFNLPIAMNDWGYVQTVKSVTAISAIGFPPYACCGIPEVAWSPGFLSTCELFVNGSFAAISDDPAAAVTYQWQPHCVVREQKVKGVAVRSTLFLPPNLRATVQKIEVRNPGEESRAVKLEFNLRAAVARKNGAWFSNLPGEGDNRVTWKGSAGRLTWTAQHSAAACCQGMQPPPDSIAAGNVLHYELRLAPGEVRELHFVVTLAATAAEAEALHDRLQAEFDHLEEENRQAWDRLLRSAFTVGNADFSGHLPRLQTDDEALWNLYHNGLKNLLTARRRSPDSAYGPTYLTLSGHVLPTLSFPWDTALSSLSLALLDPLPLRQLVEVWLQQDMHQHLATDYLSGEAVGPWYGVNDMAILRCARQYLRVTGDFAWLDKNLGGKSILDRLYEHAVFWKKLAKGKNELADYGEISNLLEVVSTYLHEVAGMNAGNVSSMRFLADLLERRGRAPEAAQLRAEATELAQRINRLLYVQGKGWWRCGQPDGSFNEVRHCYDFLAVLDNMCEDLSAAQKREMTAYFWDQLATRKWMRALAKDDPDATWNVRPDHSCLGAYGAWPPMSAKGLYKAGDSRRTALWLRELAKAGRQGPIGQGHFAEDVVPAYLDGAAKASEDAPYIEDWSVIAGGAFTDLVLDSIFGVNPTLFGGLKAMPQLEGFDPRARLTGWHYQGKEYAVDGRGVTAL